MPFDTRTLPGTLRRNQGGEALASGWVLLAFDVVGQGQPLTTWKGEMSVEKSDEFKAAANAGGELYLECAAYGGVYEPWHGAVSVEPTPADDDPNGRRLRLRSAGPLTRTTQSSTPASTDDTEATA